MSLGAKLAEDYRTLFGEEWPAWVGGLAIGFLNVFLFVFYQPWTTLDGILNWGSWLWGSVGVGGVRADSVSPLLRSGSVVNLGLLFGAFAAALLAGQFAIRVGPKRELAKGLVGGLFLGTGAAVARGCNIGGFFSSTAALAASGIAMAVGLAIGAFLATRYLLWEAERTTSFAAAPVSGPRSERSPWRQPGFGLVAMAALVAAAIWYAVTGFADRSVILLLGVVLGVVSQRSRVCFVQAFREPFLTGDTRHTRAMLLALAVSIVGFAIVMSVIDTKADDFVRPTFWIGAVLGGTIFGFGMVLAGGCGAGAIWRAGEGHVKLWLVVLAYVGSAILVSEWLRRSGLATQLGQSVFLPDQLGWIGSLAFLALLLVGWYVFARWNEASRRLVAI